jgi:hypothetical protein
MESGPGQPEEEKMPKYPVKVAIDKNGPEGNVHAIIKKVTDRLRAEVNDAAADEYEKAALGALATSTFDDVIEHAREYVDLILVI